MTTSTRRPLGLYEKYALAMHGLGQGPTVALTVVLPRSPLGLAPSDFLDAIAALLALEPHLSARVVGARTNDPHLSVQEAVRPDQVLITVGDRNGSSSTALSDALDYLNRLEIDTAPLWRVWVDDREGETDTATRVTLGIHHLLADGVGSRNLFAELLTLLHPSVRKRSSQTRAIGTGLAPTLEQTVDLRPSFRTLVGTGLAELIVPRLPAILRPRPSRSFWPNPAAVPPRDQPTALKLVSFSSDVSARLASESKSHGVRTLHPTLVAAALCAIASSVVVEPDRGDAAAAASVDLKSHTPVSLRSSSLGHPTMAGNYVVSVPHTVAAIDRSYLASTAFWSLASTIARRITSRESRDAAKEAIGMLDYVPSGSIKPVQSGDRRPSSRSVEQRQEEQTSWETWLDQRMRGVDPWKSGSFEFSNLGRMVDRDGDATAIADWVKLGMRDVCSAQPGSASGNGLQFNVSKSATTMLKNPSKDTDETIKIFLFPYLSHLLHGVSICDDDDDLFLFFPFFFFGRRFRAAGP